jgi:membrane-associated protease RseP (regulator of RpoE activity)
MADTQPGDFLIFTVDPGVNISFNVGANPYNESVAYIGIFLSTYFPLIYPFSLLGSLQELQLQESLFWFFTITLSLGIINLLPIPPLDGDRLWKELIDRTISLERRSAKALLWGLRITALSVLAINIIFTILNPGLLGMFFR